MKKVVKFATQIEEQTLKELKAFASESDRSISGVLTEAVNEYLQRARIRTTFRSATDEVLEENKELLKRLAK